MALLTFIGPSDAPLPTATGLSVRDNTKIKPPRATTTRRAPRTREQCGVTSKKPIQVYHKNTDSLSGVLTGHRERSAAFGEWQKQGAVFFEAGNAALLTVDDKLQRT